MFYYVITQVRKVNSMVSWKQENHIHCRFEHWWSSSVFSGIFNIVLKEIKFVTNLFFLDWPEYALKDFVVGNCSIASYQNLFKDDDQIFLDNYEKLWESESEGQFSFHRLKLHTIYLSHFSPMSRFHYFSRPISPRWRMLK